MMETYRFCPPQMQSRRVHYQVIVPGTPRCQHELLDEDWSDRIDIQNGIIFVTFSCEKCGRRICQSLEEVLPPVSWNRADG